MTERRVEQDGVTTGRRVEQDGVTTEYHEEAVPTARSVSDDGITPDAGGAATPGDMPAAGSATATGDMPDADTPPSSHVSPLFYVSESTDPYVNIATEEFLVDTVEPGELILFLWRNENTIVIGRNQNAWKECRVTEFESEGGRIARRLSGGGAVFHDTGNLNFTFIARDADYSVARHMDVVCGAVRSFQLDAQVSGRNDATVDGAKFSGNAFFRSGDKRCHHGTLMIGVDTAKLGRYLVPDKKKLEAKGVDSVRSRVINLASLNPHINVETLSIALIEALREKFGAPAQPLPETRIDKTDIETRAERFTSWEWRLGRALPFTHALDERFPWGNLDIELAVEKGVIEHARIYSDALDAEFIEDLEQALSGCRYDRTAIDERMSSLVPQSPDQQAMLSDCVALLHDGLR